MPLKSGSKNSSCIRANAPFAHQGEGQMLRCAKSAPMWSGEQACYCETPTLMAGAGLAASNPPPPPEIGAESKLISWHKCKLFLPLGEAGKGGVPPLYLPVNGLGEQRLQSWLPAHLFVPSTSQGHKGEFGGWCTTRGRTSSLPPPPIIALALCHHQQT